MVAGIIGGIALFLGFTRLGFIPVPIPLIGNATIMHIPAIVGGALEGPMSVFWQVRSSGYSPFCRRTTRSSKPIVAILPRLLIGVVAWAVFVGLRRWSVDLAAAGAGCWALSPIRGVLGLAILFGIAELLPPYSGHPAAGHSRGRSGRSRHGRHRQGRDALPQRSDDGPENESDEGAAISCAAGAMIELENVSFTYRTARKTLFQRLRTST